VGSKSRIVPPCNSTADNAVLVTGKKYSKTGIRQGFAKYMVKNPCVSERSYKLAVRIFEYFLPGTSIFPPYPILRLRSEMGTPFICFYYHMKILIKEKKKWAVRTW